MDLRINNETTNNFLKLSVYYFWMCILNYKLDKWSDYHFTCFFPSPTLLQYWHKVQKSSTVLRIPKTVFSLWPPPQITQ